MLTNVFLAYMLYINIKQVKKMAKKRKNQSYTEDIVFSTKINNDIRYIIKQNHDKIYNLLRQRAKNFLEMDWARYQLREEAEILMRIQYATNPEKPIQIDYTNIKNIEKTFDYIRGKTAANKTITRLEVIDIHRRLANKTKIAPGRYRISNGVILMGTGITPTDYNRIDSTMDDIVFRLTNEDSQQDFLTRALDFHYEMFATQPFDDFNKRTARMVMNWFLLQHKCEPILFNKKSDYRNYAMALVARAHGDCRSYNRYMLECLVRTQHDIIKILTKHAMSR